MATAPRGSFEPPPPPTSHEGRQLAWLDVVKGVGLWAVSVLLLIFVPVVAVLPYIIYRVATVGPEAFTPEALAADKWVIFYSVLGIFPAHLITFAVAWFVISEGGRRPFWEAVGWKWPGPPRRVTLISVAIALGLYGLAFGLTTIYGGNKTDLDRLIESSVYTRVATALVAFATAPLIEELIYRGVLYPAVEKVTGMAFAIIVVSLLFAGVHVWQYKDNVVVILVITALSFTLTAARALTGTMLPAFIIHLVFNGIQSVLIVVGGFIDQDALK
ncbi:MAG TPA: type II CAAX endopeptidase family protein [Pyrinomonadaceae bacterium]